MKGLALYIWHSGPRYDEVLHLPGEIGHEDAIALALVKLQTDELATRVQVDVAGADVREFVRSVA